MRLSIILVSLFTSFLSVVARDFQIQSASQVNIDFSSNTPSVACSAFKMLSDDMEKVLNSSLVCNKKNAQIKTKITHSLKHPEEFRLFVDKKGILRVEAADEHGLAYGLLEISHLMGVSPWEWWADATPRKISSFTLKQGFEIHNYPSVRYRGIFINDEDWGMEPWSNQTMEPDNPKGVIGPKTTEKIFQLLLRLRANTYWPPMHECSKPFFLTQGNREMAKQYGIYIGSSHCEPMACNANGEWKIRGKGEYNYVTNKQGVQRFWQERIDSVKDQEIIYTVGMRGIHDGMMQGVKGLDEHKRVLQQVINDQMSMLPKDAPKVFIPYKEVLDVYNAGINMPEDVTLMWTDDNYGYIRHFPTQHERSRKGGNGIYYHVSYWGRPHDYLWLGTFSPYLLFQQMNEAYNRGIQEMWILNVGDIKPAEYQTELFLDMAWNISEVQKKGVNKHLHDFLAREFAPELNDDDINNVTQIMNEHYRLAFIRKPEMMAGTRTEEADRTYWNTPRAIKWNEVEPAESNDVYAQKRLEQYEKIYSELQDIWREVPDQRQDCFFQLVKYPVQAATLINRKFLVWQIPQCQNPQQQADEAYNSIQLMTFLYNHGFHNNAKWNAMMEAAPRNLPVFHQINKLDDIDVTSKSAFSYPWTIENSEKIKTIDGLGYEGKAFQIDSDTKDEPLRIRFKTDISDSVDIYIAVIPTLPVDNQQNTLQLSIDNGPTHELHFETQGRSEQWKQNVIANRYIQHLTLPVKSTTTNNQHYLYIRSLSDAIIIDNIYIHQHPNKDSKIR